MSNYLERVASAAGRKAAVAKPPGGGPPLLPVGQDLSAPVQELPQEDSLFQTKSSRTPSTLPISLRNESSLTVQLPKTLRPVSANQLPRLVSSERAPDHHPLPSRVSAASTTFIPDDEPVTKLQSSKPGLARPAKSETETAVPPVRRTASKVNASERRDEPQPLPGKQVELETVVSDTRPGELEDPNVGANEVSVHSATHRAEPLPSASAMQLPPAFVSSANRQQRSRVSIGRLEVMVNNHPAVEPVRPSVSPPRRNASVNLERRYLDRFRLRP